MVSQGQAVARLNFLAFIFLPLSFVAVSHSDTTSADLSANEAKDSIWNDKVHRLSRMVSIVGLCCRRFGLPMFPRCKPSTQQPPENTQQPPENTQQTPENTQQQIMGYISREKQQGNKSSFKTRKLNPKSQ